MQDVREWQAIAEWKGCHPPPQRSAQGQTGELGVLKAKQKGARQLDLQQHRLGWH